MWSQLSFNPRPLSALRPTPSSYVIISICLDCADEYKALDESDMENFPPRSCTEPSFDFLGFNLEPDAPVSTLAPLGISNEDLLALFSVPDFDADSFLQNNGFDFDAMGAMSSPEGFPLAEFPVVPSPQAEWPLLLPLPPSSPLESPAVILTTPLQPQPAPRKCRRSVNPADIVNESRARKLRVRTF
jgi:hypothetical protein